MQKASAAAEEAGLSFEWLGSYIATVSEKTRQAPEVIGTAYNSIIARLHNIKTKGFNEEDETRINDIAKALAALPEPLKLIDSLTGEWMSMSDIFSGIAAQWDTLDAKQRAYIATTMAGTRQQNMFITLMNDMSLGAEGGSRAIELYNGALDAAGNASQKYSIYQESIVAKQEEANAKWEEFYSILSNTGVLNAYYEVIGNIGKGLAVATEETNGMNIALAGIAAVGVVVVASVNTISAALAKLNIQIATTEKLMKFTKVGLIISAIAAVVSVITSIVAANKELEETIDYTSIISQRQSSISTVEPLIKEYEMLAQKTKKTSAEQERMNALFDQIKGSSSIYKDALEGISSSTDNGTIAVQAMNSALETQKKLLIEIKAIQAGNELSNPDNIKSWTQSLVDFKKYDAQKQIFDELKKWGLHSADSYATGVDWNNAVAAALEKWAITRPSGIDMAAAFNNNLDNLLYLYQNGSVGISNDESLINKSWMNALELDIKVDVLEQQYRDNLNRIASFILENNAHLTQEASVAQKEYIDGIVRRSVDDLANSMAAMGEYDETTMEKAIAETKNNIVGDIQKFLHDGSEEGIEKRKSVESSYIGSLLDSVFGSDMAWREEVRGIPGKFSKNVTKNIGQVTEEMTRTVKESIIASLLESMSTDEIARAIENVTSYYGEGSDALAQFWKNWLGSSNIDKAEILKDWSDNIEGIKRELANSLSKALEESDIETPDSAEGLVSTLTNHLIEKGYDTATISKYFVKLGEALEAGRPIIEELMRVFSSEGIDGKAFDSFNEGFMSISTDEWLEKQQALTEGTLANWESFFESMSELSPDDEEGAISFIEKLMGSSDDIESLDNAAAAFRNLSDEAKNALKEAIPMSEQFWKDLEDGGEITEDTRKQMERLQKALKAKNFKDTRKAIKDLSDGVIDASDAYKEFTEDLDDVQKAHDEFEKASEKVSKGVKLEASDVENLANVLGYTMPNAAKFMTENWDLVSDKFTSLKDELVSLKQQMDLASFIQITGTSIADFSALQNGLLSTKGLAEATVAALRATGSWKLEKVKTVTTASIINPLTGETGKVSLPAESEVLTYTGTDGLFDSPNTNSGGGGGGGGNNKPSADEQMVNDMDWEMSAIEHKLDHLNAIMQRYENQGYLTGLINALELENELLEEQQGLLESNIKRLENRLKKLRQQLSNLTPGTQEYNDLLSQIELLQEQLAEYTIELEENASALEENADLAEEYADQIRDMEIELRDTIEQAIRDRIEREEEALDARIEMENLILDAIIARHKKERDEIMETTEAQIKALEDEMDALDEAFEERKRLADEEDKQAELAALEEKYNRMIVDPTRAKEAQDVMKDIQELRDEIAWDTAEKEVEAQKEALEQQVTSLEEYAEYIEKYYSDLLENPRNFIDEINEILGQSNEQVIAWLKENNEEFANSTDATQEQTVSSWTETLNTMHGIIVTYWDEVEDIISQGDEAIIEFLMENSQDYAEAGELQAEAYVDAWMEQLEALHDAYEDLVPEISDPFQTNTSAGSGSGTGGGGGGGGGGGSPTQTPQKKWYVVNGATTLSGPFATQGLASNSRQNGIKTAYSNWSMNWNDTGLMSVYQRWNSSTLKEFAKGGIADFTGPAWLDGTKAKPERILSSYQTSLFEELITSLHGIRMRALTLPRINTDENAAPAGMTFTGDIIVNVDKLDSDTDYEELGEKIMTSLMTRANRGSAVGGIRITK